MHSIERKDVRVYVFASALYLLSAAHLTAQTTVAEVPRDNKDDEQVVVLTPFMVEGEDVDGYSADSTLAGTRVRTDLKDTASAISVVTKQFLKDTGVTSNQELLVYTPSTEVSGLGGNFSGFAGAKTPNESTKMANPGANNRVRGLDSADNTRDYFLTDIPWDSFNVGRIDLQRGPNSILFGVGSPAGIINASINDANYRKSYKIENIVDKFGSLRNSIDLNHVLLKKQLALRFSYVDDRRKFQQEPAFSDSKRLFAAVRYDPQLLGKDNHTTVRVKFEHGDVNSNNPRILPPADKITPWFTAPYSKATINTLTAGSGSLSSGNATVNLFKPGGNIAFQGLASTVDVRSWFNGASSSGTIPTYSNVPTNVMVGMINSGVAGLNPGAYRPLAIPNYSIYAAANLPGGSFYLDKVLTDPTVFDFFNNLLDGPNKREWQDWRAMNVDLQQTFFKDRLSFDLTYDKQSYRVGQIGWLTGSDYSIGIEVNQTFPDGSTNPNVGRPYVTGTDAFGNFSNKIDRTSKRGIVALDVNSADFLGKNWASRLLGRNVLTGLVAKDEKDSQLIQWSQHSTTPELITMLGLSSQSTSALVGTRQFDWITYLGPKLTSASSAAGAGLSRIPTTITPDGSTVVRYFNTTWNAAATVDRTAPYTYTDFNTGQTVTGTQNDNPANYVGWTTGAVNWLSADNPADFGKLVTGGEKQKFSDSSRAFTWQGYLLDGVVVPTFGWRKDKVVNYATAATKNVNTGVAPTDYGINPASMRVAEGQSRNWSGVVHIPARFTSWMPGETKLSAFYNDSSNFKADAPRRNMVGDIIDNPRGETKERGFVVDTLNDRLTFRANWFETRVKDATLATGGTAIFGGGAFNMYQVLVFGYMEAGILQDAMNGVSDGAGLDDALASQGWTNYAYSSAVPGVGKFDNLTNTTSTSAYQTSQVTKDAQAAVQAWLNTPAFMTKSFFQFWNSPVAIDPSLAKTSGRLTSAYGANSPFTGFMQLVAALSPSASTLPTTTVDTLARGQEFELTARPTKNWNVALNYTRTFASREKVDRATIALMNAMNDFFSGPAGNIRQFGQVSTSAMIKNTWRTNLWLPYQVLVASQGQSAPEVAPWRLNLVSTYQFSQGRVKGLSVGGAARLEAGRISGYRYNSSLGLLDVNQPLVGPKDDHFDFWVGYSKKLKYQNLLWRVQLNVRNAFEKTRLIPAYYEPDGSLALARIQDGMSWRIANSIEF